MNAGGGGAAGGAAIGYCRVSTGLQASEGVSLEAQQARIAAWCAAHERILGAVYVDAISGKRADNRPELQKALAAVCGWKKARRVGGQKGKSAIADSRSAPPVLVFYSLSRLARSTRDAIQIAERLERAGADLVSLTEDLNTTTAAGKMLFRLLAVFAEFERDLISERTSTALQYKKAQGKRVGTVPYGWDLAADGQTLIESAREQETIARMLAWRNDGLTLRKIAERLTSRRVGTKNRRQWHAKTVLGVLRAATGRLTQGPANA